MTLINEKPENCPKLPTQKVQILKLMKKPGNIDPVYNTHCPTCNEFTENRSMKNDQRICCNCETELRPNETNYFVSLPIEKQIKQSITNKWRYLEERADSNVVGNITDVCDGEIVKEISEKFNCSDTTICSLSLNFDGASRYKSNNLSIWPIQLVQNFLPPSIRYHRENIIIAGLYYGKHKPDCLEYFLPLINELKRFVDRNIEMQLHGIHIRYKGIATNHTLRR